MKPSFSSGTSASVTVGATSTAVIAGSLALNKLIITNISDENVFLSVGADAVQNKGIALVASGGQIIFEHGEAKGPINAICASGSKTISVFYA